MPNQLNIPDGAFWQIEEFESEELAIRLGFRSDSLREAALISLGERFPLDDSFDTDSFPEDVPEFEPPPPWEAISFADLDVDDGSDDSADDELPLFGGNHEF